MSVDTSVTQITLVGQDLLDTAWVHARMLLNEYPTGWEDLYRIEDIYKAVKGGDMQLWLGNTSEQFIAVVLTELRLFPKQKMLNILCIAAKDLKRVLPLLSSIEFWAGKRGAQSCCVLGRTGWRKVLATEHYTHTGVILHKDISQIMEH